MALCATEVERALVFEYFCDNTRFYEPKALIAFAFNSRHASRDRAVIWVLYNFFGVFRSLFINGACHYDRLQKRNENWDGV
jgi:hypothetical protein